MGRAMISCICVFKGCTDQEGCKDGRITINGNPTITSQYKKPYIENVCAYRSGKEACPKMCGECKYLILIN